MATLSIPLADAPALRTAATRARILRWGLATALLICLGAAFLIARSPDARPTPLLPAGSRGIIVLDLSASVEHATLARMYASLTQLAASDGRFGLVIVSSRAYEALPPNTPAAELRPVSLFFRALPSGQRPRTTDPTVARYPTNPWEQGFSFGTTISSGLDLARTIILANHVSRPSVWLISDLADDPKDRPLVRRSANAYSQSGIVLNLIALHPSAADTKFFESLLGSRGSLIQGQTASQVRLKSAHHFPYALGIASVLLAVLLAANELWSAALRWGPTPAGAIGGRT